MKTLCTAKHLGAVVAGLLWVSGAAEAGDLKPVQAGGIVLGAVHGVAFFTIEPDGYRVVMTIAADSDGPAVQFTTVLRDEQKLVLSVAGPVGSPAQQVEIARKGDKLTISDEPAVFVAEVINPGAMGVLPAGDGK